MTNEIEEAKKAWAEHDWQETNIFQLPKNIAREARESYQSALRSAIEAERQKMVETMMLLDKGTSEYIKREAGILVCDEILKKIDTVTPKK